MKCEECQQFLEEYIDGELDGRVAAQVSAHANKCAACSKAYQELKQELEIYAHYERDVEVTPALWAGVEARIRHERAARDGRGLAGLRERFAALFATPRFSPALVAALVLVAVGLTVVVMSVMNSRNNNQQPVATDRTRQDSGSSDNANKSVEAPKPPPEEKREVLAGGGKDTDKPATVEKENKPAVQKQLVAKAAPKQADPAQLVREAEQKYIAAISILSRDFNRRRSQIDPTVLARFDSALADIDRTIKDTRRVVREHPDDPVALQYLLSAYAKKVDALRDMALD